MAGATEVWQFQVTVPINTTQVAPQITNIGMPTRTVLNIRARIPPGWNGQAGFAIGAAGQAVIPINGDTWITGSDEIVDWALANQIDSGAWQVQMYNTGNFPHTLYLLFTVELPDQVDATAGVQPVVIASTLPPASAAVVSVDTTLPAPPELT